MLSWANASCPSGLRRHLCDATSPWSADPTSAPRFVNSRERSRLRASVLFPARWPGAHDLAQDRELADVIGVMVADESHFSDDRVPGRVRDRGQQVRGGVGHQVAKGLSVCPETLDSQRELLGRRDCVVGRPVFLRPRGSEVGAVLDVVQHVFLGDADVLEQVPRRVRHVRW